MDFLPGVLLTTQEGQQTCQCPLICEPFEHLLSVNSFFPVLLTQFQVNGILSRQFTALSRNTELLLFVGPSICLDGDNKTRLPQRAEPKPGQWLFSLLGIT